MPPLNRPVCAYARRWGALLAGVRGQYNACRPPITPMSRTTWRRYTASTPLEHGGKGVAYKALQGGLPVSRLGASKYVPPPMYDAKESLNEWVDYAKYIRQVIMRNKPDRGSPDIWSYPLTKFLVGTLTWMGAFVASVMVIVNTEKFDKYYEDQKDRLVLNIDFFQEHNRQTDRGHGPTLNSYDHFVWHKHEDIYGKKGWTSRLSETMLLYDEERKRILLFGGSPVDRKLVSSNSLYVYDVETGDWTKHKYDDNQVIPFAMAGGTIHKKGRYAYVFGGHPSQKASTHHQLFRLDLDTYRWKQMKPNGKPPRSRKWHMGGVYGNKIVYFGGLHYMNDGEHKAVKNYTNYGEMMGEMKAIMWTSDHISVHDRRFHLNEVLVYDIDQNKWKYPLVEGDIPRERIMSGGCVVGDKLYLVGGGAHIQNWENACRDRPMMEKEGALYVLDLKTWIWDQPITYGNIPPYRMGHSMVAVGSNVIMFGGTGKNGLYLFNDLHILDTNTNTWFSPRVSGKVNPRSVHAAVVAGDCMHVIGGEVPSFAYSQMADVTPAKFDKASGRKARRLNVWNTSAVDLADEEIHVILQLDPSWVDTKGHVLRQSKKVEVVGDPEVDVLIEDNSNTLESTYKP